MSGVCSQKGNMWAGVIDRTQLRAQEKCQGSIRNNTALMAADHSDSPQSAIAKREKFRPAVKIVAALLYVAVFLVLAEVVLRLFADFDGAGPGAVREPLYSQEELRRDLQRYSVRQGGDCITVRTGLYWDPRFGFASKKLNKACAHKLFCRAQDVGRAHGRLGYG